MFLLSFPDELLSCILANWLDLKDVVRMDSALCSGRLRKDFLSLLSDKCTFQTIVVDNIPLLNYVIMRQLRSNDISIDMYTVKSFPCTSGPANRISEWIHNISDSLQKLTLISATEQLTECIIRSASHLESVHLLACLLNSEVETLLQQRKTSSVVLNCCDFDELRYSPEVQKLKLSIYRNNDMCRYHLGFPYKLNHLRTLDLSSLLATDQILIEFSLHCPNVVHLHVGDTQTKAQTMMTIMSNFCNLQSLYLVINDDCTNQLLDVIAERHGHSLRRLFVDIYAPVLTFALHRLLSACAKLHTLYLWSFSAEYTCAVLCQLPLSVTSLFIYSDFEHFPVRAITDNGTQLCELGLISSCFSRRDDQGVQNILSECMQLQKVYLSGSEHEDLISTLRNSWPKVQFVYGRFPAFDVMVYE